MACLGSKWEEATPIVEILAFTGCVAALLSCVSPAYLALGLPRTTTFLLCARGVLGIPAMILAARHFGLVGVAWAELCIVLIVLPVTFAIAVRTLRLSVGAVLARAWRPVLAAVAMFAVVRYAIATMVGSGTSLESPLLLISAVAIGAGTYALAVVGLWVLVGRPEGIERRLIDQGLLYLRRSAQRA
jgi:O-antigen/teichoic acid export membrane protein